MKIMIDEILKQQNKTRYWLSKETGITYPNIVKLCNNNTTSIRFSMIDSICHVLNCNPSDIIIVEPLTHD